VKALGFGNSSREGAKSQSLEEKDENSYEQFSSAISGLCGLCAAKVEIVRKLR
jgi:hypothetical protein